MENGASPENRVVPHVDIAREEAIVGHHIPITHANIVTEMHSRHEEVAAPDMSGASFLRPPVDGNVFAKSVVVADDDLAGYRAAVVEVLWRGTDHGSVADEISGTEVDAIRKNGMRLNRAVVSYDDVIFNDGIGANFDIFSKASLGANESSGMDFQKDKPKPITGQQREWLDPRPEPGACQLNAQFTRE
jgi:hypothetical protein